MRLTLCVGLALLSLGGGCSLLVDPTVAGDGSADTDGGDGGPEGPLSPTMVYEGARQVVVLVNGDDLAGAIELTWLDPSLTQEPELDCPDATDTVMSQDRTLAARLMCVPYIDDFEAEDGQVRVTLGGEEIGTITVRGLPEITALGDVPASSDDLADRYSEIHLLLSDDTDIPIGGSVPYELRAVGPIELQHVRFVASSDGPPAASAGGTQLATQGQSGFDKGGGCASAAAIGGGGGYAEARGNVAACGRSGGSERLAVPPDYDLTPLSGSGGGAGAALMTGVGSGGASGGVFIAETHDVLSFEQSAVRMIGQPGTAETGSYGGGGSGGSVWLRAGREAVLGGGAQIDVTGGTCGAATCDSLVQNGSPGRIRIDAPFVSQATLAAHGGQLADGYAGLSLGLGAGAAPLYSDLLEVGSCESVQVTVGAGAGGAVFVDDTVAFMGTGELERTVELGQGRHSLCVCDSDSDPSTQPVRRERYGCVCRSLVCIEYE